MPQILHDDFIKIKSAIELQKAIDSGLAIFASDKAVEHYDEECEVCYTIETVTEVLPHKVSDNLHCDFYIKKEGK
jgi:hypothetical protein